MTATHRPGPPLLLALAFALHAGFSVAQTSRFDWGDISAVAWADASIVPPDIRNTNSSLNTPDIIGRMRDAAEKGDALAQFSLGRAYEDGNGVPSDDEQAHLWYRKAADQRLPPAEFAVGMDYARGQGVQFDAQEAVEWIRRAATQGHAGAQYSLGMAYATGKGIERDGRAAIPWFRKAANQGMAAAQFKFAVCPSPFPDSWAQAWETAWARPSRRFAGPLTRTLARRSLHWA